ncbi:MAG: SIMPL domain-containing protein [Prevotella sp.]|nr:SIMPL domain-containing protein [Prevotella sp.]MBQ9237614.1 SIMPL domain-containing protein [Prevotella sp.]MBR1839560.1 SIMPL domain-containing protein [Prevotella sp.]
MEIKDKNIIAYALVALSIVALGWFIKAGIDDFANKDRRVVVKGLSEKEVNADKVTWPIVSKEVGNDLPTIYDRIGATQGKIKAFLLANGIKEAEMSVNAPQMVDLNAREYGDNKQPYRYIVTSVITVTSKNVAQVRKIISRQGDLLKEGVAIVEGGYDNPVKYEYISFKEMKPKMMQEAIENAEKTAEQFAENSHSKLDKIVNADQGQFSIDDRDSNTPWIKKVRVVTTVTYSLKD